MTGRVQATLAIILGVTLLALIARPVYKMGIALNVWQPLARPAGVSRSAVHVATMTESTWFECSIQGSDVDICRAWDDAGHLIARGRYRLDGEKRAATRTELDPSYVDEYPGHPELAWIYLKGRGGTGDKTLVPVNDAGVPLERFGVNIKQGGASR